MKKFLKKYKYHALVIFAVWSFISGFKLYYTNFGKPNGFEEKYPLFLLNISLIAIYAIPLILLARYLTKRFEISKKVVTLSWILGLTASLYLSGIGHLIVALFWIKVINPPQSFINQWGAAVSGPFAEEFAKGLTVLIILLLFKKMDLKHALVSGMIVGLSFQIIEDCIFTFRNLFVANGEGFATLIERIVHAGGTHWTFSILFAVGMVALIAKNTGFSKIQGVFWLMMGIFAHFLVNSPFNDGIDSKTGEVTVLILTFNLCLAIVAIKSVDKIESKRTEDAYSEKTN
ncbi:PrsW family intramembrane metalloprotease [Staphylococcus agnetis]|uniref:PrsW family glutamic-type intramembrane protease n=1 Tax=Staphylococcus agnetis TaxID=985762 RepID=UPI0011802DA8|nr:PrsW family glutamic-type intramembrane protease [Staphylococcus agnetis]TRW80192.1 PrsW family intramembrane metalloprotease [Staphylococcus agnetis]